MFRRRTRALLELGVNMLALFAVTHIRKYIQDEPTPVSPGEFATGVLTGATICWAHDHDVGKIRTSRRRRILAMLVWTGWQQLIRCLTPDPDTFQYNFGFGTLIGTVTYRLWYGLLHPLPGDD